MRNFVITVNDFNRITKTLSHRKCVTLALYCAELAKDNKSQLCIDLVQQYLDNPDSVTTNQLTKAAYDVWAAAYAAARSAAFSAAYAADAAYYATRAAVSTKSQKSKIIPYLDALTKSIPKTPFTDPFEIIIYLQDQELYPILDGNRLNLWDKDYEYQVTGSIEEIANTLGVRNLLNSN